MSGDWIKMRTDLYRDPKVCVIADLLRSADSELSRHVNQHMQCDMAVTRNVMRNVTVGALVSVWGVLRHCGKRCENDLIVKNCTVSIIDDVADIPGFGDAMAYVGWVEETEDGIVLPRFFDEFNVDPAEEAKAKNAARQRRYREKQAEKSNVTVVSKSNAREEERREENIIGDKSPKPSKGTRIPDDFKPNDTGLALAESLGVDVELELGHFRDHHAAKGSVMKDWQAAWRTWARNSRKFAKSPPPIKPVSQSEAIPLRERPIAEQREVFDDFARRMTR